MSLPFFYSISDEAASLEENIAAACVLFDAETYRPNYYLGRSIGDSAPVFLNKGEEVLIKFVLQKAFPRPEDYQLVNYRYPVVIYINQQLSVLSIVTDIDYQKYIQSHEAASLLNNE